MTGKLKEDIYWTGYIDWDLRNFHGYSTPSGSTYNSYLIVDESPTLIDTVKHYGFDEMLWRIKRIIDPQDIRYIISNHTEMDHSGSLLKLIELCPGAEVVCSPKGEEGLRRHFKKDCRFKVVESGDTLNIGKRTLSFHLTPMVHWPDSMATYSPQDLILFSNDAFGQHYASSCRFADEAGLDIVLAEAAKYYANIVMPYGSRVLQVLEALKGLSFEMICPSHGLIWRRKQDIEKIAALYEKWASYRTDNKVVIVYDTMWRSTEKIAQTLYELLDGQGVDVKLLSLKTHDYSDVITQVQDAKVVMMGSPILNNRIFPAIAGLLAYMKGLKPKNRFAFSFGSYGWAKVGFKELEESLQEAGMQLLSAGKYFQYVPDDQELESLQEVAVQVKELLAKTS